MVPSAWNADAIAIRGSAGVSSAQSNDLARVRVFERQVEGDELVVGEQGLQQGPLRARVARVGRAYAVGRAPPQASPRVPLAPRPLTARGSRGTADRRSRPACPSTTRSRPTAAPSSTCSPARRRAAPLAAEAANLPKLVVGERELSDLEMLAVGALSPLTGFQGEADYRSVLDSMHLANGLAVGHPRRAVGHRRAGAPVRRRRQRRAAARRGRRRRSPSFASARPSSATRPKEARRASTAPTTPSTRA